jgi:hypothetical protein
VLGFGVVVNFAIANRIDFAMHAVVQAWLLVGLLIPVKVCSGKKA